MTNQVDNPITLSWNTDLQTQVTNLEPESASPGPSTIPADDPPGYVDAQKPTKTLKYTFSQLGCSNSMLLVPPSTAPDTRPQYYITTNMNPFMPLSFVTTVYRGSNEYGEIVGEFEMGIINTPAKLKMKSVHCGVDTALKITRKGYQDVQWEWKPVGDPRGVSLRWNFRNAFSNGYQCVIPLPGPNRRETLLATFSHPPKDSLQLYMQSQLEVTVAGQDYFDHILISALILERKRLTPKYFHYMNLT